MDPAEIPLRDLHLPADIGWWPPAPGWWLLLGLAGIGLLALIVFALKARAGNAARCAALRMLDEYAGDYRRHRNPVVLATQVSALLRRVMLAYAPRSEIAGLTGREWLEWLDRDLDDAAFAGGVGRQLLELPYRNPDAPVADDPGADDLGVDERGADEPVADDKIDALLEAVRRRIRTPVGGTA